MSEPDITGVVFDLDGTLYTLRGLKPLMALELWRSLAILRYIAGARRSIRGRDFNNGDALERAFMAELARRSGIERGRATAWYRDRFLTAFVAVLARWAQPRPELRTLLGRLRTGGVKLAVVSDFPVIDERLRAIGVAPESFHLRRSSEEIGALKPSPKAFQEVAASWGIEPREVLVVGDRADLDAAAAVAAGMPFLGLEDRGSQRGAHGGTTGFVSWRQAKEIIATRTGIGAER